MRMLIDDIVDFCFSILNSTEIKNKKMGIFTTQTNFLLIQKKLFVHKGFTHFGRAFMSTNMLYYIGNDENGNRLYLINDKHVAIKTGRYNIGFIDREVNEEMFDIASSIINLPFNLKGYFTVSKENINENFN